MTSKLGVTVRCVRCVHCQAPLWIEPHKPVDERLLNLRISRHQTKCPNQPPKDGA